ncbi:hypothetical protein BOWSER_60 [Gordonia phage Bowser]|uniref:DUF4326 domain-containing protein n=1 Tax=Gordonia phage Bowser TaxID=1838063 RepID=A0A160DCT3_9CAUD|nr:hypothetical protein BH770_gp60 [Gordonia phage Bowser]ANA85455.1 hypothetical protein BOWSER_60 [Gordonia phage Bowser]
MPQRIQRRRTKGWRMPEGAVYVGRPTKWGNPFVVGEAYDLRQGDGHMLMEVQSRMDAAACFDWAIHGEYESGEIDGYPVERIRSELAGRDLVCWCPLDQPCHADLLLELANVGDG